MPNKKKIHRPARDRAVAELLAVRAERGRLTAAHYEMAAQACGYSPRQLKRMVAAQDRAARGEPDPDPQAWLSDPDVIAEVMLCCGNLANAHKQLTRRGKPVPSLSTFRRHMLTAMGATMIGKAKAKNSRDGVHAATVYLPREPETRGHSYLLDHTELPIYVIPDGHQTATRPWMTAVMDAATRYLLSWVIAFGTPSAEEVRAALMGAFTTRPATDGATLIGGAPDRAVWDRGLEFLSDLITESCLRLDVTPVPLPAYSPHLKGSLERFWRFLKSNALPRLPGYTDAGADLRGNLQLASHALSEAAFLTELVDWIDDYNTNHVNRSLGGTALQAWRDDPTPLRKIPMDQLWLDFLVSSHAHTVGKTGIRFHTTDYIALNGELDAVFGRSVEVRYLPHDDSFIEVFHQGRHLATCFPAAGLRPDDKLAFLAARKEAQARATRAFSAAHRQRASHPDARKIAKTKTKKGRAVEYQVEAPEPDLFTGGEEALRALDALPGEEDGQGRLL